ncbi:MAG: biotin/lipoyl-containing protein, partial [Candidatus Zixiibacteriota bacterium]
MARYLVKVNGREFDITLEYCSEKHLVTINGRQVDVVVHKLGEYRSIVLIDNESNEVDVHSDGYDNQRVVFMRGLEIPAEIEDYNLAQLRKTAGMTKERSVERILKAAMPGLVVDVRVQPGDKVEKDQALLVIEAMKMENIIKAQAEAKVKVVHVSKGASVEKDDK